MVTYIALLNYTDQGIKNAKQLAKRIATARKAAPQLGCKLVTYHLTFGPYDAVAIIEAKNDEAMAAFALATASVGNVGTLTMRAFTEAELKRIVKKLP